MAEELQQEEGKKKKEECPAGAPMWMTTFSDLVTLLLTFFVLLLSMSHMDEVKFNAAAQSMQDAFGRFVSPSKIKFTLPVLPATPPTPFIPIHQQNTQKLYNKIQARIQALRLSKDVHLIKKDETSVILRIEDSVLFRPGSAHLEPESYPMLRSVADIIRPLPMDLRIEGHTDNTPVAQNRYGNWNLSVARAVSVLRYYKQSKMLSLDRMSAVGYGADRPTIPNTSEEAKAKNRRVDFILTVQAKANRPKIRNNIPL